MSKEEYHNFRAFNANFPNIYTLVKIKKDLDVFNMKKVLIKKSFAKKNQHLITDLLFIKNLKGAPQKTHRMFGFDVFVEDDFKDKESENLFMSKFDNCQAYELFFKNQIDDFYFLGLFLDLKIIINNNNKDIIKIPLSYENNSYDKLINIISQKKKFQAINVFQNNKNLDDINKNLDLKQYCKIGLIAFTYPIQVIFIYGQSREKRFLKDDIPLSHYYKNDLEKSLNIISPDLIFSIQGETIDINTPIHQILKKYDKEPVCIDIENVKEKSINVLVKFGNDYEKFTFSFDKKKTAKILCSDIQKYFGIKDQEAFLSNAVGKGRISPTSKVSELNNFVYFNSDVNIEFKRIFKIAGTNELLSIIPKKKIGHLIKQIAEKNCTDYSLVTFKLKGQKLEPSKKFSEYIIDPEQEIVVEISDFKEFISLYIFGATSEQISISVGFSPSMKINSIKSSKSFTDVVKTDKIEKTFFFLQTNKTGLILDGNEKFQKYGIKDKDKIVAYVSQSYILRYENSNLPFYGKLSTSKITQQLKTLFNIELTSFFIDYNGKPIKDEEIDGQALSNGDTIEIKRIRKLNFKVHNGDKTVNINDIENTKQVKDLIQKLVKGSGKQKFTQIQLFNDLGKPINSEEYLYKSFSGESDSYEIIAKKTEQFSFIADGKFFNEFLPPSLKIRDAIKELIARGKKIEPNCTFVFRGRILNENDSLEPVLNDDDEPVNVYNEIPPQIMITLKFKDSKGNSTQTLCPMIKGSLASDVRLLAAQLTPIQNVDEIVLIANNNQLNDDDELNENTEITVDLGEATKNDSEDAIEATMDKISKTLNYTLTATTQIIKETAKNSESSDDSFLEYEDEVEDPFEKGNGTYEASIDSPDTEYVFIFKEPNEEPFKLQLPKDVTVKDVKDKISERNNVAFEDITIFVGNQRLADFSILTALVIPKSVHYFTVKIVDLKVSIICTRIK